MKDFFISYTSSDEKYAKWIAELLERNGYTTIIQAWDFRPGDNFVSKINEALTSCKKMIIVLSENYMKSNWCQAEWTSKIADQIKNGTSTIIPIIIRPVRLNGSLLEPISHINIIDMPQAQAETKILNGILNEVPRKADGYPHPYNIEHNISASDPKIESFHVETSLECAIFAPNGRSPVRYSSSASGAEKTPHFPNLSG